MIGCRRWNGNGGEGYRACDNEMSCECHAVILVCAGGADLSSHAAAIASGWPMLAETPGISERRAAIADAMASRASATSNRSATTAHLIGYHEKWIHNPLGPSNAYRKRLRNRFRALESAAVLCPGDCTAARRDRARRARFPTLSGRRYKWG
jgi:hypothetical protein